jgi:OTU-like cysteine protease
MAATSDDEALARALQTALNDDADGAAREHSDMEAKRIREQQDALLARRLQQQAGPELRRSFEQLGANDQDSRALAELLQHREHLLSAHTLRGDDNVRRDDQIASKMGNSTPRRKFKFFLHDARHFFGDGWAANGYNGYDGGCGYYDEVPAEDFERQAAVRRAGKVLKRRLAALRLAEYVVKGDGCCQFRSVSDQLYRSERMHRVVRQLAIEELSVHPERYRQWITNDYERYIAVMAASDSWGDHVTLQAIANAYRIRINLITSTPSDDEAHLIIEPVAVADDNALPRSIWLSYAGNVHYNSLYSLEPVDELAARKTEDHSKCTVQ